MKSPILAGATALVLLAGQAMAAEVTREATIAASADEVWAHVGPWCAIQEWHPVIAACSEEEIDGVVHRRLTTGDGGELLEKRLAADEAGKNYSYEILESPLPVANYKATLGVEPDGDGSIITWSSNFDPEGASEEEAVGVIGGIYDAGFEQIAKHFAE